MIYKLLVPGPIEDVEQVRVLEWHGGEGQAFAEGELVVELETHKALVEVRAGQAGILRSVISQEGDWVDIGSPLALLSDSADEQLPDGLDELAEMALSFEVS
ncbi:MAG: 2-oxoglutarate dehydrogenase [Novosphingobium sp.]|nr:lipoyl domain-containing protein [Novosphingobium sp.]MCP5401608.1 2-oxoglutarate dehydrogenase [Novosphingobium sp.]